MNLLIKIINFLIKNHLMEVPVPHLHGCCWNLSHPQSMSPWAGRRFLPQLLLLLSNFSPLSLTGCSQTLNPEHYGMHKTPNSPGMCPEGDSRPESPGSLVGLICCSSAQPLVAGPAASDRHQKGNSCWGQKQAASS